MTPEKRAEFYEEAAGLIAKSQMCMCTALTNVAYLHHCGGRLGELDMAMVADYVNATGHAPWGPDDFAPDLPAWDTQPGADARVKVLHAMAAYLRDQEKLSGSVGLPGGQWICQCRWLNQPAWNRCRNCGAVPAPAKQEGTDASQD